MRGATRAMLGSSEQAEETAPICEEEPRQDLTLPGRLRDTSREDGAGASAQNLA